MASSHEGTGNQYDYISHFERFFFFSECGGKNVLEEAKNGGKYDIVSK